MPRKTTTNNTSTTPEPASLILPFAESDIVQYFSSPVSNQQIEEHHQTEYHRQTFFNFFTNTNSSVNKPTFPSYFCAQAILSSIKIKYTLCMDKCFIKAAQKPKPKIFKDLKETIKSNFYKIQHKQQKLEMSKRIQLESEEQVELICYERSSTNYDPIANLF